MYRDISYGFLTAAEYPIPKLLVGPTLRLEGPTFFCVIDDVMGASFDEIWTFSPGLSPPPEIPMVTTIKKK